MPVILYAALISPIVKEGSFSEGVAGLDGSVILDFFLYICSEFFGCIVISLGYWRKTVCRIAELRGLVLRRY